MQITSLTAAGAVIAAALVLSGCGVKNPIADAVDGAVNNAVENAVENAIENEIGSDVDFDLGSGGASVPDGFPSELPLPDGRLATSIHVDGTYVLTYTEVSKDAFDGLVSQFKAAGYSADVENELGDGSTTIYMWSGRNGTNFVTLNLQVSDEEPFLLYSVGPDNG